MNNRILEFIEDLYSCKDPASGVEGALKKLCRYYKTDCAYVAEVNRDEENYKITYEWNEPQPLVVNRNLDVMPEVLAGEYETLFDSDGVFSCRSMEELGKHNRIMAQRQKIRGTKAMLQGAIWESGHFAGYISICDRERERDWTREEIKYFAVLCRIVSTSVLQTRLMRYYSRLTYRDILTKSWNKKRFLDEAERRLADVSGEKAFVSFDIKNFKALNNVFGYDTGNLVLIEVSSMLRLFIEPDECFARTEADCFILFLIYREKEELENRLKQLLRHIEHLSAKLNISFSFCCMAGVCLAGESGETAEEYMEQANTAKLSIKDFHKGTYAFFDSGIARTYSREKYLASQMKEALKNGEFIVYYQPRVLVSTGEYAGLEALVRWQRPKDELIFPDDFIPLFEKNGFIIEIDLYVFEQVCKEMSRWQQEGKKVYPVSVNISRRHIQEAHFIEPLVSLCRKYGIAPGNIELEITESAFLKGNNAIEDITRQIREQGFLLSMDDFGTGYSTLNVLKDIQVDILKLDKEFFKIVMNEREKIIISNIIHMAKELEIQVISEGIETSEHVRFLREIGCDMAQGYFYARPVPLEALEEKLWGQGEI